MQKKHDENEKRYNLRPRIVSFAEGQEVFLRNAKFGPSFVKARVRKKLGNAYSELEDLQGRYHAHIMRKISDNNVTSVVISLVYQQGCTLA